MTKNNKLFFGILILALIILTFITIITIDFSNKKSSTTANKTNTSPINKINTNQTNTTNTATVNITNTSKDPVKIAREFLATQEGIRLDQLGEASTYTGMYEKIHVNFPQVVEGIPVLGGEVIVTIWKNGEVSLTKSIFFQIDSVDIPKLNESKAKDIIEEALMKDNPQIQLEYNDAELIIYPKVKDYYVSWKIDVHTESPFGAWRYFVDATNGKVLDRQWMIVEQQ